MIDNNMMFFTGIDEAPAEVPSVDIDPDLSDGSWMWLFIHAKLSGETEKGELIFDVTDGSGGEVWSFNASVWRASNLAYRLPMGWSGTLSFMVDTMDGLVLTAGVNLNAQHAHNFDAGTAGSDDSAYESCLFLTSEGYPLVPVGYRGLVSLDMQ